MSNLKKACGWVLVLGGASLAAHSAHAWSDHALITEPALASLPEVIQAPNVRAEKLVDFLLAEKIDLVAMLDSEESWERENFKDYPLRPDSLRFTGMDNPGNIQTNFFRALRINPEIKVPLFLQQIPGVPSTLGKPELAIDQVSLRTTSPELALAPFALIQDGEWVRPLDVITTASDEPDYGTDIGIWEDSGTSFGRDYGFGNQSFGNPAVSYSSQAPFHMGFYHESDLVYLVAGYLKKTYPEYRIHQDLALSEFAFKTGHPYWGWRFLGWAVHYLQDLAQPYHSTALPGVSTPLMLLMGGLDEIGLHQLKNDRLQIATNRHFALENYEFRTLQIALSNPAQSYLPMVALANSGQDEAYPPYTSGYARNVISLESNSVSTIVDETIERSLPERVVSDPSYLFGTTDPSVDVYSILQKNSPEKNAKMESTLAQLLQAAGAHTRNAVRAVIRNQSLD